MASTAKRTFSRDDSGSVLVEALMLLPVLTIFSIGVLEFGNVLWQRHQVQTGVRDAARYWSRCRPVFSLNRCSQSKAKNIAFYGNPEGNGSPRVPGWTDLNDIEITPASPPGSPTPNDLVTVTGTLDYIGSPLFSVLNIPILTIEYTHSERYLGW